MDEWLCEGEELFWDPQFYFANQLDLFLVQNWKGQNQEHTKGDQIFQKLFEKIKNKDNLQCRCQSQKMILHFKAVRSTLEDAGCLPKE